MAERPLGTIWFNGYSYTGRRLDGRTRGESINLPNEGLQGANEIYEIQEQDIPSIVEAILGQVDDTGAITTPPHYLLPKLYLVDIDLTPMVPTGTTSQQDAGLAELAQQFNSGNVSGAAAFDLQEQLSNAITSVQYRNWMMHVKYEADVGWDEEWKGSGKVAAVEVLVPTDSGQKQYPKKLTIPFPEGNLTLSRRRLGNFDPQDVIANYVGKINSADIELPSGKIVPAKQALLLTFNAKYHKQAYGARYWTVAYEMLVQPWDWNKTPHRVSGGLVTYSYPASGAVFGADKQADFNDLMVD